MVHGEVDGLKNGELVVGSILEVVYYHIAASGWIITGNTIIHDT